MATALLCIGSCTQDAPVERVKDDAVKSVNTKAASVKPNINKAFVDPNVNVDIWADRWTGESREVFALRHEILDALTLMRTERLTTHGFRSTFRDWAGDRTYHQREVIEAALAHRLKDKAEAAYRRSTALEKRRKLMQDWDDYCSGSGA